MRFHEFNLGEGASSQRTRYNSELGLVCSFVGGTIDNFDPLKPELHFPRAQLKEPEKFYDMVRRYLAPNYEPDRFQRWFNRGQEIKQLVADKLGSLPQQYGWAGGQNQSDTAADVVFYNSLAAGVSVKDQGGITLANLTPRHLGLEQERGVDVFSKYSNQLFLQWKQQCFTDLVKEAKNKADTALGWHRETPNLYTVTYVSDSNKFVFANRGRQWTMTEQEAEAKLARAAPWQRVLGDWFVAHWNEKSHYASALFTDIARQFKNIIAGHLTNDQRLKAILKFADRPYFYATADQLYYVPDSTTAGQLKVKNLDFGQPNGVSQYIKVNVGRPDSDDAASVLIYLRSANGLFSSNTTVRVQALTNPQYISWELLTPPDPPQETPQQKSA